MNISSRETLVLGAIIDYYLTSGDTVGSRTLVKKYGISFSSATIRNVMADLEDQGFISKTHTSSGRVPTSKGYKYYLDTLLEIKKLSEDDMNNINLAYEKKMMEMEEVLNCTSNILSKLSTYAGVVIEPDLKRQKLQRIELVYITEYTIMAVLITENGETKTKKIRLKNPLEKEELISLAKNFNRDYIGENIQKIYGRLEIIVNKYLGIIVEEDEIKDEIISGMYLEGAPQIIENMSLENPKDLIGIAKFFEGKDEIRLIFEKIATNYKWQEGKANVVLGEDLGIAGLEDLSFIFSVYHYGDSKGVIGIIGPKRMEYSKTVGLVDYVTTEVNKVINRIKNE